jgi:hypothetical protein
MMVAPKKNSVEKKGKERQYVAAVNQLHIAEKTASGTTLHQCGVLHPEASITLPSVSQPALRLVSDEAD